VDKVKPMLDAGVSLPTAIKEALLPMTIGEFAAKHRLHAKYVSNAINGAARVNDKLIAALMKELPGADPDTWKIRFWEASKPTAKVS
jgi:hypothetical protein